MSNSENNSLGIFAEQVRLLYVNSTIPILVSIAVAVILCWTLWDKADTTILVGWFSLFFIVSALRLVLLYRFYTHEPETGNIRKWHLHFLIGTYAVAAAWGLASFFLYPHNFPQSQVIFILAMTGMSAAAIASLGPSLPVVSGYLAIILLSLAGTMILHSTSQSVYLGLLVLLFLAVCLSGVIRINRNIRENIELRFQSIQRETLLKASQDSYQHIFDNAPLGIFHYDSGSTIVSCNSAFADIIGSPKDALVGVNMLENIRQRGAVDAVKASLKKGDGFFEGDYSSVTSGKTTPVRAFFKAIRNTDQEIVGGVGILEDFTERRLSEQQIQYHTTYDALTGLPNRRLLVSQLGNEISRATRHGRYGALIFLDLDNFKTINDSLGHSVGDKLLKLIANRLTDNVRREDCVARMGGDEFIIILTELDGDIDRAIAKAKKGAENIRDYLSAPCKIDGYEMHVTPSIGVSLFPKQGKGTDDIFKQADAAMYKAKGAGSNEIRFFLPSMQKAADEQLRLTTDIRKALLNDEFAVWYQPQVNESGNILGAEALVRWHHPERGLIAPGAFLKIAEETGLMWDIGQWVLRSTCEQISRWAGDGVLKEPMVISVNISGKEFSAPAFVQAVRHVIEESGVDPNHLGIELTEGSLVSNVRDIVDKIITLRQLGIKFSVDDFGTGYSSLHYLQTLPLNTLKIDRSFVNSIKDGTEDVVLVDTIIMMARNLGLEVIAEGVETERELAYLSRKKCTIYQGYYFCKPVEVERFTAMLKSGNCRT